MPEDRFATVRNLFVRRWGEMAQTWGVSRTMAEIHALLFISPEPLCTDDIMNMLAVSRGSASTNLRQLLSWGLVERMHQRTDRKEYFEAEKDVWVMFETITRERRRREVEPIVETLERCLSIIEAEGKASSAMRVQADAYRKKFLDILELFSLVNNAFNAMTKMGVSGWKPLAQALERMGAGAASEEPDSATRGSKPPASRKAPPK